MNKRESGWNGLSRIARKTRRACSHIRTTYMVEAAPPLRTGGNLGCRPVHVQADRAVRSCRCAATWRSEAINCIAIGGRYAFFLDVIPIGRFQRSPTPRNSRVPARAFAPMLWRGWNPTSRVLATMAMIAAGESASTDGRGRGRPCRSNSLSSHRRASTRSAGSTHDSLESSARLTRRLRARGCASLAMNTSSSCIRKCCSKSSGGVSGIPLMTRSTLPARQVLEEHVVEAGNHVQLDRRRLRHELAHHRRKQILGHGGSGPDADSPDQAAGKVSELALGFSGSAQDRSRPAQEELTCLRDRRAATAALE